jgi:hypothetical protein
MRQVKQPAKCSFRLLQPPDTDTLNTVAVQAASASPTRCNRKIATPTNKMSQRATEICEMQPIVTARYLKEKSQKCTGALATKFSLFVSVIL